MISFLYSRSGFSEPDLRGSLLSLSAIEKLIATNEACYIVSVIIYLKIKKRT